jgi:hypothetical protein
MRIVINNELNKFYSYEELKGFFLRFSKLPGFSLEQIGLSEEGEPIELLSYRQPAQRVSGKTKCNSILLYGGEDASEPIFSQTIFWLLSELSNADSQIHRFATNWHFVSCINPDGYKKNSGWLNHPGDMNCFLENSWEDIHSRMIFWKSKERMEHKALKRAIALSNPDFIYNMHDESHFPAEGYKFAFSSPVNVELLNSHLERVKDFMDVSSEELLITDCYGRDPRFSVYPAFEANNEVFAFLNESCGYKLKTDTSPGIFIDIGNPIYDAIKKFKKLQIENFSEELQSSLFHTDLLIDSIEGKEEFNSKMLSITGYGLNHLISKGVKAASEIKEIYQEHINTHFQNTYDPIPVWQQVFTQIDFLFTILEIKGILVN